MQPFLVFVISILPKAHHMSMFLEQVEQTFGQLNNESGFHASFYSPKLVVTEEPSLPKAHNMSMFLEQVE